MLLGQGVLDQRPVKKRPSNSRRSVSPTQIQQECFAKLEACAKDLGISRHLIGKVGGFVPSRTPGPVIQERLHFAVDKLREAHRDAPKPFFDDLNAACRIVFELLIKTDRGLYHTWKPAIRCFLTEIQDNNWWWTKLPIKEHPYGGVVLRELTECEILQSYGTGRGRLHRVGPVLAENPEACQDLLIAPPTQEDIVNQIESLNLEGMIGPSVKNAVPSDRVLEPSTEPLPSVEDRIDLHLSQVNDLLRHSDLTASVTIELRKLKHSLLKTQLQVFKP